MVRVMSVLGLSTLVWLLPVAGYAQVYTCKDSSGKFIIADRLLKECANSSVQELDKRGMPVRDIAAPLTEAERQRQDAADNQRNLAQAKEDDRERQGQAIMARYKSEQDIEAARKKEVAVIDQRIADNDAASKQAQAELIAAQNEAKQATAHGNTPDGVQKRVTDAQFLVQSQQKLGAATRQEKVQINARYAQTLQQFRALSQSASGTDPVATPAQQPVKQPAQ